MLVLSRKPEQSIQIGEKIRITVVSVEGSRVRIGIDAPREMAIFRSELLEDRESRVFSTEEDEPFELELDLGVDMAPAGMVLTGAGR